MRDYLRSILTARVYDVAIESPLDPTPGLTQRLGNTVLLKREDLQEVFSFKLRGAYNKMAHLSPAELKRGVICASAGNHAQGVALGAQRLGTTATIVMPVTTPRIKIDACLRRGAQVVLHGDSYHEASLHAHDIGKRKKLTYVHPYDDPLVIAGQGTIGMEILRQHQHPIDAIFVPVGGGGLIAGIAAYVKQISPGTRIIGVEPEDANAMYQSLKAGKRVELDQVNLFADGVAVKQVGAETFRIARELVDEIILVDTDEICAAIKDIFEDTRSIVEPSGGLGVAGAKRYVEREGIKDRTLVALACGANMNFDRLRFVAERAEMGEHREAVFGVTIPEQRGSFRRFCELIGNRNVTEFNYRISDPDTAHLFVGMQVTSREDAKKVRSELVRQKFPTLDLTDDELAKLHLRHLVGGRSSLARGERIFRFEFPERPGALMQFLSSMAPSWNITLFHYRNHGADYGRILVGMQVPPKEQPALRKFIKSLGFACTEETDNPALKLFL